MSTIVIKIGGGEGIEPTAACESTICKPITDDVEMQRSILEIIATQF